MRSNGKMKCTIVPKLEALSMREINSNCFFVIIDVLRFSTTAIYLLKNGARYLKPYQEVHNVFQFKQAHENAVLVGEKGGKSIKGFDFNNSPSAIAKKRFNGKMIAIRTSNGTRAIKTIGKDKNIFIGGTVNAKFLGAYLRKKAKNAYVYLIAVGSEGTESIEDMIGAKMIYKYCMDTQISKKTLKKYKKSIKTSKAAEKLRNLGFPKDVKKVLEFNSVNILPKVEKGKIVKV